MASASAMAFWAFSASVVPSQLPVTGDASSRFTTSILYPATIPLACSTAKSTARFMAVPSGIIAPCIGQLVYSLRIPFGCSPAKTGAMPRVRKQITTHRLYCEVLHPFILGSFLLVAHGWLPRAITYLPMIAHLPYTNDSGLVNVVLVQICKIQAAGGTITIEI